LLEAADPAIDGGQHKPSYSIDTVRRVKQTLGKKRPLVFSDRNGRFPGQSPNANEADELLAAMLISSWPRRPGFSLADVASSLPRSYARRPGGDKLFRKQKMEGPLVSAGRSPCTCCRRLTRTFGHADRAAVDRGSALKRLVPDAVAEYIHKERLFATLQLGR